MVEFGRFGILADGRPIRLGGRVVDGLTALIEASWAVVGKDELLEPRPARQDRRSDPAIGQETASLRKGFIADRELIPMVADGVTRLPAKSACSRGTGGPVPAEALADERFLDHQTETLSSVRGSADGVRKSTFPPGIWFTLAGNGLPV